MKTYDYIAIGGGSAGIASANRAAEYGAKALIIEEEAVGGTCVNVGCVPKKISWIAATTKHTIDTYSSEMGLDAEVKQVDYQTLKKNRDAYIDRVHHSYFSGFESRGTAFVSGHATFVDNHTIEVNGETYTAPHIAIVAGGRPFLPDDIEGIELAETSNDFFQWETLPQRVVIVGAGYVGTELAGVLNHLGVEVTMVVRDAEVLTSFDQDFRERMGEQLRQSGIQVATQHTVKAIRQNDDHTLTVMYREGGEVTADRVIMAVGRIPNTDRLGLENTDVLLDKRGFVKVDDYFHTSVEGVYAFGDIIGRTQLTPVAIKAGRTLSDTLFNGQPPFKMNDDVIPTVMFTEPPIGKIGLTEAQAIDRYGNDQVKVYKNTFTAMQTALGDHREPVLMKLITQGADEKIVGLWAMGVGVDEMIQGFAVAIQMGATKADFDRTVAIHPTGSEELVTMR
ncbi:MAG: glutathione-disulfide reductase [Aerococcus sp.]|nr:glutathione-disulfide reductase [Aerococcus sp.]